MNALPQGFESLLFREGRELANVKFFPGSKDGLTSEEMCLEAEKAIRAALRRGLVDNSPKSLRAKTTI